jgi:peptidoglycan/xylan/chitin deacetylase (PgdA/CDA1 family)
MGLLSFIFINLLLTLPSWAQCDYYYLSLDFGGEIGQGEQILEYFNSEGIPFTVFLVGKTSTTAPGKKVCSDLKTKYQKNRKIQIANHTISHRGFTNRDTYEGIRTEIIGNESFMNQCDASRVIKYFRYPLGQAHPEAERVLKDHDYLNTYQGFFTDNKTSTGVWWTTDTRDWVKPTGASVWAQLDYYSKNKKFLPVDEQSWRSLGDWLNKNTDPKYADVAAAYDRSHPGAPDPSQHVSGFHGPTQEEIVRKVLGDRGSLGKDKKRHCFPLLHFGGHQTLGALKRIIPQIRTRGGHFRALGEGEAVNYQLQSALEIFQTLNQPEQDCATTTTPSLTTPILTTHTVQPGETLFGIAKMYRESGVIQCEGRISDIVERLISVNNLKSSEINIGQKLVIPSSCGDG